MGYLLWYYNGSCLFTLCFLGYRCSCAASRSMKEAMPLSQRWRLLKLSQKSCGSDITVLTRAAVIASTIKPGDTTLVHLNFQKYKLLIFVLHISLKIHSNVCFKIHSSFLRDGCFFNFNFWRLALFIFFIRNWNIPWEIPMCTYELVALNISVNSSSWALHAFI